MKLPVYLGSVVMAVLLLASCGSGSSSDEPMGKYLEMVLGKTPSKTAVYVLVSDYGCSSCKEEIYRKAESGSADTVFIITSPRNTAVLTERFSEILSKGTIHIDSLKHSKALDVVFSKPMVVVYRDERWEIVPYEEGGSAGSGM